MSTRGHTLSSCRSSLASEAFAPLLAGTNRCQLRWPLRRVAAVVSRRAAHCTPRLSHGAFHLRGRGSCTGRGAREKTEPRALDDVARVLLVTPRAPGSPIRLIPQVWKTWGLVAPAETLLGCNLAKGCAVERVGVPSAAPESLRERRIAPPCAPEPCPRHAASVEALLGGTRAFVCPLGAPSSDEESASNGLDPLNQGSRSPGGTTSRSARHGIYDRISSRAAPGCHCAPTSFDT